MAVPVLQRPDPRVARVARRQQTGPAAMPGAGARFVRHSQKARRTAFDVTAQAFNTAFGPQILKPVGGYLRYLDVLIVASGGTTTAAAFQADAPYNVFTNLVVRDPFGEPIVDGTGFLIAEALQLYGGLPDYSFLLSEPTMRPSFSNVVGATGAFTFRFVIPLEMQASAYCALPSMNASAQPTFQGQLATAATVLSGTLTTPPTLEIRVEEAYWIIPIDAPDLTPPDLGSSRQFHQVTCPQSPANGANVIVQIPRVGTYITDLIILNQDSAATAVRRDNFPDPLRLAVDGVAVYDEPRSVRFDVMAAQHLWGANFVAAAFAAGVNFARPTGLLAYTFRDSQTQTPQWDDNGDLYLETTPGTLLELGGSGNWGAAGTSPNIITALLGELYPRTMIPYDVLEGR